MLAFIIALVIRLLLRATCVPFGFVQHQNEDGLQTGRAIRPWKTEYG